MTSNADLLLPGQPVALPQGPPPKIGEGMYSRDGIIRASVLGTPQRNGLVCEFQRIYAFHSNDHPLGRLSRLTNEDPALLLPTLQYWVLSSVFHPPKQ